MSKHPTAIISPRAQVADSAEIGPFCIIDDDAVIGERTVIEAHTRVWGSTRIGDDNHIYGPNSIGAPAQHKGDDGVGGELIIGNGNLIREFCTLHRGTAAGGGKTVIGDHNWFLAYAHVAHDCIIGNHALFVRASLAGHVEVGDYAVLGGVTLVRQFCRIGCHAFTGRTTFLAQDLTPYTMAIGDPGATKGLNLVGLRRHGFSQEKIDALNVAYKFYVRKLGSISQEQVDELARAHPEIKTFTDFIEKSKFGITS